ncbi:MAG: deoxyribodipyrimidine photolyase, partial [Kofleriaceae bacterium]
MARGDYVVYWMIAARRTRFNAALDHAIARATELARPLVVLEPLRCGYAWASDRMHAFVIQGMADNASAFAAAGITYLAYVERVAGAGRGLLEALAARACCVVTDEQPGFFLPHMVAAAGARLAVRLEQVDGNGILPLRASDRAFPTAAGFRRHLQRELPPHLLAMPVPDPLASIPKALRGAQIPGAILRRWGGLGPGMLPALAELPIDHTIAPVRYAGGSVAAAAVATTFVKKRLDRYDERSHPDANVASGLSPYLHFGHIGAADVVTRALRAATWNPSRLADKPSGSRAGWWGVPPAVEGFLDEIITWRELGYGFCFHRPDYARYTSLPAWAKATLAKHATDPRPVIYTRAQLDAAETADPIWNAAQRELRTDGRIQNYLRMLWGKKILEWSKTPQAALATLIELNNKYAVDGRDPNSYSGIFWTLGRFDRPWGPERPIFGLIRYMSSDSTKKKLDLAEYLA